MNILTEMHLNAEWGYFSSITRKIQLKNIIRVIAYKNELRRQLPCEALRWI